MKPAWNPARRRVRPGIAWTVGAGVLVGLVLATWFVLAEGRGGAGAPAGPVDEGAPAPPVEVPVAPTVGAAAPAPDATPTAAVVAGVVLSPEGRLVAGATVRVLRALTAWPEWRSEPIDEAITGRDGRFEFRVVQRHGLLVEFSHPSFAGGLEQVSRDGAAMRLRLQQGFELFGEVRTATGAAVANAVVALESTLSDQRRARSTTTAANGSYRFVNLPAGPVRIVARHEAWQPVAVPAHVVGDVVRRELVFERLAMPPLRGRVVAATTSAPVEGALVELLSSSARPGLAHPFAVRTAADGTFAVAGLPRGNMMMLVRHGEHGAWMRSLTIGAATADVVCEMPSRSQVGGRLVSNAGFAGGTVLEIRDPAGQVEHAPVGSDGRFRFAAGLSPGAATIAVLGGGFAFQHSHAAEVSVRIREAAPTELELAVEPPAVVRGRVVDETGRPLPGALVFRTKLLAESAVSIGAAIRQLDLGGVGSRVVQLFGGDRDELVAMSAADGAFEVRGQAPGLVSLRIELPGRGTVWLSPTVLGPPERVDVGPVVMEPGARIQGRVFRNRRGLAGAVVTAAGKGSQAVATTRKDGTFVIEDLRPGEYGVRARLPSMPTGSAEQRIVAAAGAPGRELSFEFDTGRFVRGEVAGSDGQPVVGALVDVRGVAGQTTLTDDSGGFVLEVPPRAIELQVALRDRSRHTVVAVGAAEEVVRVRIDTPPVTNVTAVVAGLPGRERIEGAILRFARLDDGDTASAQAAWVDMPNGELEWRACPVGRVRVEFWCQGFAPYVVDRTFLAGVAQDLGEILLEPGGRLAGVVRDGTGAPVEDATVWLGDETDAELFESRVRTGPDGSFRLAGVTSRSSRLVVRAAGFAPRTVDLVLPSDVLSAVPREIVLERGATIEVLLPPQQNGAAARVELRQGGRVLAAAAPDDAGTASFPNRAAGSYEVALFGSERAAKAVVVGAGVSTVRVRLED